MGEAALTQLRVESIVVDKEVHALARRELGTCTYGLALAQARRPTTPIADGAEGAPLLGRLAGSMAATKTVPPIRRPCVPERLLSLLAAAKRQAQGSGTLRAAGAVASGTPHATTRAAIALQGGIRPRRPQVLSTA